MTIDELIARLLAVYGAPTTDSPREFFNELRRSLRLCSGPMLAKICDHIVDNSTFWPRPAEIRKAWQHVAASEGFASRHAPPEHQKLAPNEEFLRSAPPPDPAAEVRALVAAFVAEHRGPERNGPPHDFRRGQRPSFERMQRLSLGSLHSMVRS